MFSEKRSKEQDAIDGLIGAGTSIEGNVIFAGGLRLDGRVKGNISAEDGKGMLVVAEQARVEGEIRASQVVINGTVVGPVHAGDHVELQSKANVTGDVHYNTLQVQLGAVVQGRLVHHAAGAAEKVVQLKPASSD